MSCRDCTKCELSKYANNSGIDGIGNIKSKVVIVGDNPNPLEDKKGQYGLGNSFKILEDLVINAGLKMKDIYYTPCVKCVKPTSGKISNSQMKACKEILMEELLSIKPEIVIALGATALKIITNRAKITEIHGQLMETKLGFKVYPVYNPSIALRDPRFSDPLSADFRRLGRILSGEEVGNKEVPFTQVVDKSELARVVESVSRSRVIAFDLETNGLQPRYKTSRIGQTVISTLSKNYVIEHEFFDYKTMKSFHTKISELMSGKEVIAQNGKFDNLWLYYQYGIRFPITFDVMLAHHLLDENSPHNLKQMAQSYLDADNWDVDVKVKKGIELTPEQKYERAKYSSKDGYYTINLYKVFKRMLMRDESLYTLFRKLVMPVARTYEQVEINGTHIDLSRMSQVDTYLKNKIGIANKKLKRVAGEEINVNSTRDLNNLLFNKLDLVPHSYTPGGLPSTAEDALLEISDQHTIVQTILDYRGAFKQRSTFINGWKKALIDGRIYPSFKVAGTVTGRPSCSEPNLQQVPRDPLIRSLIGAPEGYTFFEADYSQVELRIAAAISGEPTMLRIFRSGGDIHTMTYQMIMGMTPEEAVSHMEEGVAKKAQLKEERKKAKAINFGFIYGMGYKTFQSYCKIKMGLTISLATAKAWRERYFSVYSGLSKWHDRQRRIVGTMGQVRTFTGRIRHLPQINSPDRSLASEAERLAINSPVQGFGAEMLLMAMVEVNSYFKNDLVKLSGTIHDALVGIVRTDQALGCLSRIKYIMENLELMKELEIELPIPIIADVSLGNWGIGKELSLSDLPEPIIL